MRVFWLNLPRISSWLCYGLASWLIAGCTSFSPQPTGITPRLPTPTVSALFHDVPTSVRETPTAPLVQPPQSSAEPITSATALALAPTRIADQIAAITIFDDALNADWSATHSDKVKYDLDSISVVHGGKKAIMVTPTDDFGEFFLTVNKGARKIYPRDRVLGISFWLNGGGNTINTSDLAVTVTGSNQYVYWVADDTSVKVDTPVTPQAPLFPETRLYYLHINHSIPPNTWVKVVLWLDDQLYEPDYVNITGVYIKNDKGFLHSYYIDDMQLLLQRTS